MDRPGTDTRVENADNLQPPDRPPAPPPDRPGAPGSRSRIADRRAANEGALAEAEARQTDTQQTASQESGAEENDEQRRDEATSSSESTGEEQDPTANATTADEDQEIGDSEAEASAATDEVKEPDERGEDPRDQEDGGPLEETRDDSNKPEIPKQDDRTSETAEKPEAPAEPQTTEAGRADGPVEEPRTDEEPATEGSSQTEVEPTGQDEPSPAPADQQDSGADPQLPTERDDRQVPEDLSRADETTDQPNTRQIRLAWPPAQEGTSRWTTPIVYFNDRTSGTQPENRDRNAEGQPQTSTPTNDDPNKYRHLPDRPGDGMQGRGDPIPPGDDPADRNPDPESERQNRWERYDRIKAGVDGVKKVTGGAKPYLEKPPPPTGQTETKVNTNMHSPETHPTNPADAITGGVILFAAAASMFLEVKGKLKSKWRRNEGN